MLARLQRLQTYWYRYAAGSEAAVPGLAPGRGLSPGWLPGPAPSQPGWRGARAGAGDVIICAGVALPEPSVVAATVVFIRAARPAHNRSNKPACANCDIRMTASNGHEKTLPHFFDPFRVHLKEPIH